jgi:hypothetical protein
MASCSPIEIYGGLGLPARTYAKIVMRISSASAMIGGDRAQHPVRVTQ